ncbi:MAG: AraC family transcriptional regulator [Chloroflexota bacterium]
MNLQFEERPAESPLVERIWRSYSEAASEFVSIASINYGIVVTKLEGKTFITVRGPETKATPAYGPPNAEWCGIVFKPGTFIPHLPANMVMDRQDANLPEAGSQSFWLQGKAWEYPDFDNADTFVERLIREGLLVRENVVDAALQGQVQDLSLRSTQRRFVQSTGLSHGSLRQIERARQATLLLQNGSGILDVVERLGYADQPHLTRTLKHMIGQTPAQIIRDSTLEPLGYLYKSLLLYEDEPLP